MRKEVKEKTLDKVDKTKAWCLKNFKKKGGGKVKIWQC